MGICAGGMAVRTGPQQTSVTVSMAGRNRTGGGGLAGFGLFWTTSEKHQVENLKPWLWSALQPSGC